MKFYSAKQLVIIHRVIYVLILCALTFRFYSSMMPHQLQQPVLINPSLDKSYQLLLLTGLPQLLVSNFYAALTFDSMLFILPLSCIFFPKRVCLSVLFSILMFVFVITQYSYLCFHKHNLAGLFIASIIPCFTKEKPFTFTMESFRFYILFVYSSAAFWKISREHSLNPGHFHSIIAADTAAYLYLQPSSKLASAIRWLLKHQEATDWMMKSTILFQASYVVGFFTKRVDLLFLLGALLFHLISAYLLRAYFGDFAVLLVLLVPWHWLFAKLKVD